MCAVAVLALLTAAAFCPAAPSAAESEPNDLTHPDNWVAERGYNMSSPTGRIEGNCTRSSDFTSFHATARDLETITYELTDAAGSPSDTTISLLTPASTEFRHFTAEGDGRVAFVAQQTGNYVIGVMCDGQAARWALALDDSHFSPSVKGPNETEHNDLAALASSFSGESVRGAMDLHADPADFWRIPANASDVTVHLAAEGPLFAHLASVDSDGTVLVQAGSDLTLRDMESGGRTVAVMAEAGYGFYNLTLAPAAPRGAAPEGSSEDEPNDIAASANAFVVQPDLTIQGAGSGVDDPVDWYHITFAYASRTNITIASSWTSVSGGGDHLRIFYSDLTDVLDPYGDPLEWDDGYLIAAPDASDYYLRVDTGYPGGAYTITLDAPVYPLEEGAVVDVLAGNASGTVAALAVRSDSGYPLKVVSLPLGGNGIMFGECMELFVLNRAPVGITVELRAGTRLRPEDPVLSNYVTTRTLRVDMEPWSVDLVAFHAAMETSAGTVPGTGFYYFLNGSATGNEARVANATSAGNHSDMSELVALWAAAGMGRAELKNEGAVDSAISEAARILNDAGVQTSINPPPYQGPAPSPGATSPPWGLIIGVAFVGVLVLGTAVRAGRRRRAALLAPSAFSPPRAPPAVAPPTPIYAPRAPAAAPQSAPCPTCGLPVTVGALSCPACNEHLVW